MPDPNFVSTLLPNEKFAHPDMLLMKSSGYQRSFKSSLIVNFAVRNFSLIFKVVDV